MGRWEKMEVEGQDSLVLTSISPKDEIHVWTKLDMEPLVAHEVHQRYLFQNADISFPLITEEGRKRIWGEGH